MNVTLTAETGRTTGSRTSNRLRREGKIPGVVYGLGSEPVAVAVEWSELRQVLTTDAGLNALIELEVDGKSSLTIVKDVQRDPVRRAITHVDFVRIDADVAIEVEVPVVLTGEPVVLAREGGLIEQLLHSVRVKARPDAIPNEFEIDITDLAAGSAITVGDIPLPAGVTIDNEPDEAVATGFVPRGAGAAEEGAEAGEPTGDEAVDAASND